MKGLILDTSKEFSLIALVDDGRLISWEAALHGNQLSKSLLPSLQLILSKEKINYIGVGSGPGSFTGTRIGVAVAKSLAFGLNIPLIGFDSPLAYLPEAQEHLPQLINTKFKNKEYTLDGSLNLTY